MTERRRGQDLDDAILNAAWEQLLEGGYATVTMETVAARAGTSKPVLYRRWTDRAELARAAITRRAGEERITIPDTGSLREDMLALLIDLSETRAELVAIASARLGDYFLATGTNPEILQDSVATDVHEAIQTICTRAVERGEANPERLTGRIPYLALDLTRHDLLARLRPPTKAELTEIVDDIFLPLVRSAPHPNQGHR